LELGITLEGPFDGEPIKEVKGLGCKENPGDRSKGGRLITKKGNIDPVGSGIGMRGCQDKCNKSMI